MSSVSYFPAASVARASFLSSFSALSVNSNASSPPERAPWQLWTSPLAGPKSPSYVFSSSNDSLVSLLQARCALIKTLEPQLHFWKTDKCFGLGGGIFVLRLLKTTPPWFHRHLQSTQITQYTIPITQEETPNNAML